LQIKKVPINSPLPQERRTISPDVILGERGRG
jgi:hypothetical protein